VLQGLLGAAGSVDVEWVTVDKVGESPPVADAATGLVEGNPVIGSIMERRPEALPDIEAAVARRIAAELGAHVFTAVRPRLPNSGVRP
jgi:hypothetical protein